MKRAIQVAKRMADRQWGERLGNDFEGNKNLFWKEVQQVRKGEQAKDEMVIIIIYHDFLPPPRRGSHVKSDNTHTVIKIHSLAHILDT